MHQINKMNEQIKLQYDRLKTYENELLKCKNKIDKQQLGKYFGDINFEIKQYDEVTGYNDISIILRDPNEIEHDI